MGSVALFSVPLSWISGFLPLIYCLRSRRFFLIANKLSIVVFSTILLLLLGVLFNSINIFEYMKIFPENTTSNYGIYVALRYLNFFIFISVVVLTYIAASDLGDLMVQNLIYKIGVIVSIYALYVYIAHFVGFPELLPRSRLGTGGGEQSVVFTYAFHRAVGSFREPSHLAEWLILPLALSFVNRQKFHLIGQTLIGATILLTGSLTGILSVAGGFVIMSALFVCLIFARKIQLKSAAPLLRGILMNLVVVTALFLFVNFLLDGLLTDVVFSRASVVYLDGLGASNRDYVYEYLDSVSIAPFVGAGFGNPQIQLAGHVGADEVASLLNLYLNVSLSVGVAGVILLVLVLLYPIFILMSKIGKIENIFEIFVLFVAYMAWLIAFSVHSEELSLMFAVLYGLIIFKLRKLCITRQRPEPIKR
jgi:hypothetical protein